MAANPDNNNFHLLHVSLAVLWFWLPEPSCNLVNEGNKTEIITSNKGEQAAHLVRRCHYNSHYTQKLVLIWPHYNILQVKKERIKTFYLLSKALYDSYVCTC